MVLDLRTHGSQVPFHLRLWIFALMISRSPAQGIRITSEPGHARGPNPRYLNDDDDDDDDVVIIINNNNNNNNINLSFSDLLHSI